MTSAAATSGPRVYRYYDLIMAAFVAVLMGSNLIGAPKVWEVGGLSFSGGLLFFPIVYVFGDILTEVYGYARARRVVWTGFGALGFMAIMTWVVLALPPGSAWPHQDAMEIVFGGTPRIVLASLIAFLCGEFSNSVVLAKLKVRTEGRRLWMRTIGSTIVGEAVDTAIFYPLAFIGVWDHTTLLNVMLGNYTLKVLWEVLATPLTYRVVSFLKRAEREDYYDRDTNFTPFSVRV